MCSRILLLFSAWFIFTSCQKEFPEKVSFQSPDGLTVLADLYQTGDKSDPLIIMYHQSASSRGEYRDIAPGLTRMGFNCLAVDLRWGKQDFWNKVPNETAAAFGSVAMIDAYEDSPEYRQREVWPRMWDSVKDMEAAVSWVRGQGYTGKLITWGSSFSAMLQFKQAAENDEIDGLISYSPGEYNESDTTMLSRWLVEIDQPTLLVAGQDSSEYRMVAPIHDTLSGSRLFHALKGRHGSSILFAYTANWTPVWQFLHQFRKYEASDYLEYAQEVDEWLSTNAIEKGGAKVWPDAMDNPDVISMSYSDGMSGKLTFYLSLYHATNELKYLERAKEIGRYLVQHLPQKGDSLKGKFWAFSAFGNVCGPAFALTELYKETQEENFKEAALSVVDLLEHFADNRQDTLSWDLGNDVLGGLSGTGLFLLYAQRELGSPKALEMASKAGETLISRAIPDKGGWTWKRGQDSRFVLPNFSHGPVGMAYFLTSLYESTGDQKFLDAAHKAMDYLDAIALTEDDTYLIPYGFPDIGWSRAYDIGWAHGPAGVARLFIKLHQVTGEPKWLERARACYRGILKSDPLGQPAEGFGMEPFEIDQRFGLAGVASFAQDMYGYTGEQQYLEFSEKLTRHILSRADPQGGLFWPIPRFGFMANPGEETIFTGFFYGSTGYAQVLLGQYAIMTGKENMVRFVDDPFGK